MSEEIKENQEQNLAGKTLAELSDLFRSLMESADGMLRSKEADKVYVPVTEAVLIGRDYVMKNVEKFNARTQDIYTDAKEKADSYLERKNAQCEEEEFARGVDA